MPLSVLHIPSTLFPAMHILPPPFRCSALFAAAALLALPLHAGEIQLSGQITHPKGNLATLSWQPGGGLSSADAQALRATLDEQGRFSFRFEADHPQEYTFKHGPEVAMLYLYPGDVLSLSLDTERFDETLRYGGSGPGVKACQYLVADILDGERAESQDPWAFAQKGDTEAFLSAVRAQRSRKEAFLRSFHGQQDLEAHFFQRVLDQIQFEEALARLNYPNVYAYLHGGEAIKLGKGYYGFLSELPTPSERLAALPAYHEYLQSYFSYLAGQDSALSKLGYYEQLWQLAHAKLEGKALHVQQARILQSAAEYDFSPAWDQRFEEYAEAGHEPALADALRPAFALARRLMPGQPAPAIEMKSPDGKPVRWADFAGKVVYLDFWASWCGPCRAEMPHSRKLIEKMKGEEVVFLYLSVDERETDWRSGMKALQLEQAGVQALAPGFRAATESFGVTGIPTYFILDRRGRIYLRNAARPSDPAVEQQLRKALQAQP